MQDNKVIEISTRVNQVKPGTLPTKNRLRDNSNGGEPHMYNNYQQKKNNIEQINNNFHDKQRQIDATYN